MTSDGSDTGRQITNFLAEKFEKSLEYMQEGLRRIAEKRATARQRWGELPREELEAEFEKIWKGGFSHAEHQMAEWIKDAQEVENHKDILELTQNQDKIASLKEMMPQVSTLA